MRFSRLRILGFKSFVEPTDIEIRPGLTGIVGPNGCGKSNLVEALRFVMGESSYKAMRGSGMDDVIFSGSGRRPARNTAEVTLVAEAGESPVSSVPVGETGLVEITRRIEREAGSAYRINGRDVRARDVQLLFADASTGARSSALVRQGQIGELISAKPVKRRAILEDAAGISGLHSRRHEAELKLRAAEQNLERLDDVMTEIAAQRDALKRQARQAVRYRNISGDIRKAEATLFLIRWRAAGERQTAARQALAEETEKLAEVAAVQTEAVKAEAVIADGMPGLRDKAAEAGAILQRLRILAQELDREEERMAARQSELAERIAQSDNDVGRETEILDESRAALARNAQESEVLKRETEESAERAETTAAAAGEAAAAVAESEAALAEAAAALASRHTERQTLERAAEDLTTKTRRLDEEANRLAEDKVRLEAKQAGKADMDRLREALKTATADLDGCETAAQAAEQAVRTVREAENDALEPLEEARTRLSALEAEARTLENLAKAGNADLFPPLIDTLTVAPGYELALAAALGDDLDAAIDGNAPRRWDVPGADAADPTLPDGVKALSDIVSGPERLRRRLRQIGLVEPAEGARLAGQLAPGQRLVTRGGALWRWDGFAVNEGAATAAAQRLEQKNRLAELEGEIGIAARDLAEARQDRQLAADARATAEAEEQAARVAVRDAREGRDRAQRACHTAEQQAGRIGERLAGLNTSLERARSDREEAAAAAERAGARLAALGEETALEDERAALESLLATQRAAAAEARAVAHAVANEAEGRNRRLAELSGEEVRWTERLERAEARLAELGARRRALNEEAAKLKAEPENFDVRRREIQDNISSAEKNSATAADALAEAENTHRLAAARARQALEDLSAAREAKAREEERLNAADQQRSELISQISETFNEDPGKLPMLAETKEGAAMPELGVVENRLDRLRAERERLGGVNLRAEEEAREIETRLAALTDERTDLEGAIQRLRQGIQSLNKEGRERLLAAFDVVNGHFQELFAKLFGGGTAELMLTESDDPLEAGLEIMARPPGKKPQVMTLLSGGEQALTAMALIFAVFLTNPSPICVLDEVDAPLDDANVDRFCDMLAEMCRKSETRFVVVTHNPITMARMDRLFGVTMAERGISQIVSVDLETAEGYREAV